MTVELQALRRSPLEGARHGDSGRVLIQERPFLAAVDLRLPNGEEAAAAIERALELRLPQTMGQCVRNKALTLMALGPDWWLVLGEEAESKLRAACGNAFVSIVDVSAQRTCIEVSGPRALDLLRHGWEQDLDSQKFPVDHCSQGLLAKSPVLMHHASAGIYHLHVRASFARHLWEFLTDAAVEYLTPGAGCSQ